MNRETLQDALDLTSVGDWDAVLIVIHESPPVGLVSPGRIARYENLLDLATKAADGDFASRATLRVRLLELQEG